MSFRGKGRTTPKTGARNNNNVDSKEDMEVSVKLESPAGGNSHTMTSPRQRRRRADGAKSPGALERGDTTNEDSKMQMSARHLDRASTEREMLFKALRGSISSAPAAEPHSDNAGGQVYYYDVPSEEYEKMMNRRLERKLKKDRDMTFEDFVAQRDFLDKDPELLKMRRWLMLPETHKLGEAVLGVCIPFYNEDGPDLERTVESLKMQVKDSFNHVIILFVGDGWSKCSDSMRQYLAKFFGLSNPLQLGPDSPNAARIVAPSPDADEANKLCTFRLLMKAENAGKASSQEAFFKMVAEATGMKYTYLTDCGTTYAENCWRWLANHLISDQKCVGVTGHQAVMDLKTLGAPETLYNIIMHHTQGFEFEACQAMFSIPFALAGALSVIPGPCGMYNLNLLRDSAALDDYFMTLNASSDLNNADIIKKNLVLAEDRILCFLSVFNSKFKHNTFLEPRATFYFEPELDLDRLMSQRRRWINGTIAGYILLFNILSKNIGEDWWRLLSCKRMTGGSMLKRLAVLWLVMMMIFVYWMTALSVGILGVTFWYSLRDLFQSDSGQADALVLTYFVLNFCFGAVHFRRALTKLHKPVCYALVVINLLASTCIFVAYFKFVFTDGIANLFRFSVNISEGGGFDLETFFEDVVKLLPIWWFVGSLILSFFHSLKSTMRWLNWIGIYLLMLPNMASTIVLYSLCRTWELSWGNRPSDPAQVIRTKLDKLGQGRDIIIGFIETSRIAFNDGRYEYATSYLDSVRRLIQAPNPQAKKEQNDTISSNIAYINACKSLQDKGNVVIFIIGAVNIVFALLVMLLQGRSIFIGIMTLVIFMPTVTFQLVAIMYWTYFTIFKRSFSIFSCCRKKKALELNMNTH